MTSNAGLHRLACRATVETAVTQVLQRGQLLLVAVGLQYHQNLLGQKVPYADRPHMILR